MSKATLDWHERLWTEEQDLVATDILARLEQLDPRIATICAGSMALRSDNDFERLHRVIVEITRIVSEVNPKLNQHLPTLEESIGWPTTVDGDS